MHHNRKDLLKRVQNKNDATFHFKERVLWKICKGKRIIGCTHWNREWGSISSTRESVQNKVGEKCMVQLVEEEVTCRVRLWLQPILFLQAMPSEIRGRRRCPQACHSPPTVSSNFDLLSLRDIDRCLYSHFLTNKFPRRIKLEKTND